MDRQNFKFGDCDHDKVADVYPFCPDGVAPILTGISINKRTSIEQMEKINQIVTFLYQENEKLESERNWFQHVIDARYAPDSAKPDNFKLSALDALISALSFVYFLAFGVLLVEIFYCKHGR